MVAFSAGGTTDTLTRSTANILARKLGQPFVVENRPGAGGNIGTEYVVRAEPNGYTLIVNSVGPIAVNPSLMKLAYDPLSDLVPMVQIATVPNVLVVPPSSPAKDIKSFLAYAKTRKEPLNYGSTGVGTSSHLSSYMLMDQLGAQATHIPYKGADALNDLLAGRLDFMFATIPSVIGQIRAGKLRPLAVSTIKRSSTLPDLPTIAESGYPGFDAGSWFGFFGPKGTPPEVVATINHEVNAALPALKTQMLQEGAEPLGGTPEQFASFIKSEYDKWAILVKKFDAPTN
ncbi:ABC transporter substrate-binding protein [Bordetella genomosp. 12]|uniref:ABC transporter substrate-binding protein n=1 Tax=Bordetella genomosp. 12 TaxID=463035 RepID=A0A261VM95_9BORD|nr:ABC transporter substrate-binding protein [Bordetella genomosp. 12]